MMYDDLHPEEAHGELGFDPSPTPSPSMVPGVPASDREVPLPPGSPALLHQWLDGDIKLAVMRATPGGNDTVDLWTKIHDEAETLRSRTTPLYVHKRIMESLPDDAYKLQQPWYRRGVSMNPAMLLAAAVALVVAGAVAAHVAFR
ncbi:MAG: hypothetical protein ACR2MQ_11075 [Gemmatimonadaceae bacterium]